ncbi:MAG: SGNH/GDSL hydrolase family protein [Pirellulales bacterium]
MKRLSWRKKVAYTFVALAICGVCAEIALRIIRPESIAFIRNWLTLYGPNEHHEWEMEPNRRVDFDLTVPASPRTIHFSLATDQRRLRVSTKADATTTTRAGQVEGKPTIVHCIGDSYTLGWGVEFEESYPALLSELLGPSHQVINVGMAHIGLIQAIERSQRISGEFPPDVIVYLFDSTDCQDDERSAEARRGISQVMPPLMQSACRNSYLCALPLAVWMRRQFAGAEVVDPDILPRQFDADSIGLAEQTLISLSKHAERKSRPTFEALAALHKKCSEKNTRLIVVIHEFDFSGVPELIHVLSEHNIEMTTILIGRDGLLPDWHFNEEGNRLVAEAVKNKLFAERR